MNETDSATPPSSSAQQAPALRPITAQETAAQLRCPSGKLGLEFGRVMNLRNLSMIVGGVRQLDLQPGQQILELGAGDGGVLGYVLSRAQEIRYTGLDISPTMVEAARRFNTPFIEAGLASYVLYDGGWLPLADASFDCALSVNTVYFWRDPALTLAELGRVLRPGGRLCLTFSERAFMSKLPFTTHGFALLDAADIEAMIDAHALPLRRHALVQDKDLAVSKDGRLVHRPFVHLVLART